MQIFAQVRVQPARLVYLLLFAGGDGKMMCMK